jgi:hypothetical protein
LAAALLSENFFSFLSTYSKTTLIVQIIAKRNEPKARDPKLYLKAHQKPLIKLKLPLESIVLVKYH